MSKQEKFIKTIRTNRGIIHKAATLYTNSFEDREDLIQEIIYQLWRSYGSFQGKSHISTWIYRVAMNVSIYQLNQKKKRLSFSPLPEQHILITPKDENTDDERWVFIKSQIETLDLLEKGIVMLHLEGKSYKEIGEIIGISESNVGTRLSRIKEKIRTNISNMNT